MRGIEIFTHAVRMVFGNFNTVLRIGGVALLVMVVLLQLTGAAYFNPPAATTTDAVMPAVFTSPGLLLLNIAQIIIGLWVVVAWHRYILLEEEPGAFVPRFSGSAIWRYIVAGFFYSLTIAIVAIPLGLLAGVVAFIVLSPGSQSHMAAGILSAVIVFFPVIWLAYRLSPVLPAAAIENRLKLKEAWSATKDGGASLILLGIITIVGSGLINLPASFLADVSVPLGLLWAAMANWVAMMVGASILTTIYGVYVEKRTLNV
ncbi:hypothetical protein [Pararhodobacter zhoushanensis]|uniref:Glycerophosphoryl diester phosphodiesterase membrane domain-containing protein n=1 Tax=Pararhodobacter zhoushanensis TaxID=2479545 RepID=A0ABT3GUK0_9RHOB|nr:hypothetical protein [Pararhodobacter zhoushanensis]MCW1931233.1 hypothetical protein [Pararhodobacter zhoushanensis]